jgi:hypothetical protein
MKYLKILILFCSIINEIHSQNTLIETKALQFFVDSLMQDLRKDYHKPYWFDGLIIKDTIDENLVQHVVKDGYIDSKRLSRKIKSDSDLTNINEELRIYEDKIRYWETIIPTTEKLMLKTLKGLKKCKKLKWGHFLRKRYNLSIRQSLKFANFNWVEILLDKSDYEYGHVFYLKMDDEGKVIDWSDSYWIQ